MKQSPVLARLEVIYTKCNRALVVRPCRRKDCTEMADLPSGDESEDSDVLDPVTNNNVSDGDDDVVGYLERRPLTTLPSVEQEERHSRATAEKSSCPPVHKVQVETFVDEEALKEIDLVVRDPNKRGTYILPKEKIVHAAFRDRGGELMDYLDVKASSFVDKTSGRLAVTKTLINQYGSAAVAERCIFISCTTKPHGVMAVIPVNITNADDHTEMVTEMMSGKRVACWVVQPAEVERFMKHPSPAYSSIPKEFAKGNGTHEIIIPNFHNEACASNWFKVSPDQTRGRPPRAAGSKRKVDEVCEPKKKNQQTDPSSDNSSLESMTVDVPNLPPVQTWWSETGEDSEEVTHTENVTKVYTNDNDDVVNKSFTFHIPPGGRLKVSMEMTLPM